MSVGVCCIIESEDDKEMPQMADATDTLGMVVLDLLHHQIYEVLFNSLATWVLLLMNLYILIKEVEIDFCSQGCHARIKQSCTSSCFLDSYILKTPKQV